MIEKPKKERRYLKALGRVGEILIQEVLIKIGSNLIKKIGGKKTLPSILFLLASLSLFAQYPNTGNKQRLGFQTTADGLTWRGSLSDTASIQPINNQSAWVILDTINLKFYSFDFTSNVWNLVGGSTIDTASLSNRINLKLNISDTAAMLLPYLRDADTSLLNLTSRFATKLNLSDTAAMLLPYATKAYADTTGRLYARQDYTTGVTTSTLTWTQSDTLIPGGVTFVQVYRNGQILLPSQYTIPTSTSVVIAASSFKVNDNYTVIFPRGGGAGSGGGSGSLTSISGGTGILVSPDPITTTGTVSADLSVLMELTDTSLLNLTSRLATKLNISDTAAMLSSYNTRINTKLNISDTLLMLAPYFRDADTSSLNLTSRFALKLNATDTASLSNRINTKGTGTVTSVATGYGLSGGTITTTGTLLLDSAVVFSRIRDSIVDVAIGNDTIKILKQEYAPATTSVLTWTITPKFPIQLKAYILVFRNGQLLINDQYNLTDTNKITIVSNSFKVGANYTVVTVSGIGSVGTGVFPNPVYPEAGIAVSTGSAWASSIANNSSNWNIAFNDKIVNAAFSGTNTKTLTLTQYDGGTFAPTFDDLQGVTEVTAGTGLTGGTITTTGTVAVNFGVVAPLASPTFTGTVGGITKTMVGLGNVDNTTDAGKPVSTATQTALNGKENTITAGTTGQYFRGDKTFQTLDKSAVGLSNVDNTTDANKPISTLTQTALNLKLNTDDTSLLNLTSRFAAKQNTLSGTGFVKASGTNITYDNSSYLRTGLADSTYLKLSGGTLTGGLTGTTGVFNTSFAIGYPVAYKPLEVFSNPNDYVSVGVNSLGQYQWSGIHFGYREPNTQYRKSAIVFQRNDTGLGGSDGSGKIHILNVNIGNTFKSADLSDAKLTISNNGFIGINDTTPSFNLDITGTLNATGATTLGSTLVVTDAVTLSTTTTTPTSLLGKDGSNVVGTVTLGNTLNLSSGTLNVNNKISDINTSTYTVLSSDYYINNLNSSSTTIILPLAGLNLYRELKFKNSSTGSLIANGNIIPLSGSGTTTTILSATAGKWATLVSDGTNWVIMQAN